VSNEGLFTDGTDQFAPKVNSIPLSDVDTSSSETSVGQLVSNATEQMSQLVRSEVELAKTELAESARRRGENTFGYGLLYQRERTIGLKALDDYAESFKDIKAAFKPLRKKLKEPRLPGSYRETRRRKDGWRLFTSSHLLCLRHLPHRCVRGQSR